MSSPVWIEVLGDVRARQDARGVPLGPPRQRALLAMLALNVDRIVPTEELIDGVWGSAAPDGAYGSVHTYIYGLRRVLPLVLERSGRGYRLHLTGNAVDAAVAESGLRRAGRLGASDESAGLLSESLGLFRGTPLDGLDGPFAEKERVRLTELRLTIAEELAHVLLTLGRYAEAEAALSGVVREEPLRERLRALFILALHRGGKRSEALAEFDDISAQLAEQLGIDPGLELRDLHEQITGRWTEAPAQLPREALDFVGRAGELHQLRTWSRELKTLVISAIDGSAGIGKTALAVRFAHQVKDRFPDGQLYVDLRGYDPKGAPLSATDALVQLLRGLGVTQLPADEQSQEALYRSLLEGKQVLILLDNAFSVDQVRPLLPGSPGGLVVVTSRNQLRGLVVRDGARRVTLDVLPPDEAIEVLALAVGEDRVSAEPDAAAELARLCGYLPLALRVAAVRSASFPGLTLRERVQELVAEHGRLDNLTVDDDDMASVRAVFSWSYRALGPELANAFRRLGLHPGADFDVPAAAALVGVPVRRANELLTSLAGRHLLEQVSLRRYRFHDLLRVYAAELAAAEESAPDTEAAIARMMSWYLHTTLSAQVVINPGTYSVRAGSPPAGHPPLEFSDRPHAMSWFATEAANVLAMTTLAVESGHEQIAWRQAWALFGYYYSTGLLTEWISVLRVGLTAATRIDDPLAQARILNHLSVAYSRTGRNDLAIEALETALRLYPHQGEHQLRSALLTNLGSTLREAHRHEEGVAPALEALRLARESNSGYYIAGALDALCELYVELGRFREALHEGVLGLEAARVADGQITEANLLVNVGHAHRGLGDVRQADLHYEAALTLCRSIGDRYHEALALLGQARLSSSRQLAEQALELFEQLDAEESEVVREFLREL